jgi:hypothetical protein
MSSVQTNETHQPYGNPPQSQSSLLPPFLSYRSVAEQHLTESSQRLAPTAGRYDYSYRNSAVEAPASSYPSQSTDWPITHSDEVQPRRRPYSPQRHGGSYGGYSLASQGWQDAVQPYTSNQYQAGPYAFPQGYIPISHERTSGSAVERRVEPDSPEPITRGPTDFRSTCDNSHLTPLPTVTYPHQEDDSSGGHDTVSHTRNGEVDAHRYSHYNPRPNYSRVSAAIHRLQVLGSSQSAPPLLCDSLQHTLAPQQSQQEESEGVAPIAPMSSNDTPDVGTIRSATPERLPPSMEPFSPVWEFGPHDPGNKAIQDKDRRQSDDDGEYVESSERRRTDEQGPWQEKKKIMMACHFCRRKCKSFLLPMISSRWSNNLWKQI